jgi:hypothetical protein
VGVAVDVGRVLIQMGVNVYTNVNMDIDMGVDKDTNSYLFLL